MNKKLRVIENVNGVITRSIVNDEKILFESNNVVYSTNNIQEPL